MIKRPHPFKSPEDIAHHCRLVTVQHTGTFFAMDLLKTMGVEYTQGHIKRYNAYYYRDYPMRRGWIVCTLRDPVMAVISSMNRRESNISLVGWKMMAEWQNEKNVHFFPIDGPDNQKALTDLAAFLEVEAPQLKWDPMNTSPDTLNLKEGYTTNKPDKRVADIGARLSKMPNVKSLFAKHGYALPWMD